MTSSLPAPPEGWQYGVLIEASTEDGGVIHWVWGCGDGEDGALRQRRRLRYPRTTGPCLLPLSDIKADENRRTRHRRPCPLSGSQGTESSTNPLFATARVFELVEMDPRFGRAGIRIALRKLNMEGLREGVNLMAPLGDMTDRQREWVADRVPLMADGRGTRAYPARRAT